MSKVSGAIPRLISSAARQKQIVESAARGASTITSPGSPAQWARCIVTAVNSGTPTTYDVTILSGASDAETSCDVTGALGTADGEQFGIGDKAIILWTEGEPSTLAAGGSGGGDNLFAMAAWSA